MKVCVIVVTYNRLRLLKDCIESLRNQSSYIDKIIVINNGSNDGTFEWLECQHDIITISQQNLGCSAGFNTGLIRGIELGFDWFWLMDDDLLMDKSALEQILLAVKRNGSENIYCSVPISNEDKDTIFWPGLIEKNKDRKYFEISYRKLSNKITYEADQFPFLGIFLSKQHIQKAGLPLKDLFIWCDDTEYSWRLKKNNHCKLFFVKKSIGWHPEPKFCSISLLGFTLKKIIAPDWKIYYGVRNEFYINRLHLNKFHFYSYYLPKKVFTLILYILFFYKGTRLIQSLRLFTAIKDGLSGRLGVNKNYMHI